MIPNIHTYPCLT